MIKARIKIKGKVFSRPFEFEKDYLRPESLDEALREDGKDQVLNYYLQMRVIKFRDYHRTKEQARRERAYLEGLRGLDQKALDQIRKISPEIGEMVASLIK